MLVVIDEFTRECLAIEVSRSFTAKQVVEVLRYLVCHTRRTEVYS